MSITRKLLKGMGLTQEQEDTIIQEHSETVDALKAERDQYKEDAKRLPQVQAELDKAQKDLEAGNTDDWKGKYEKLNKEYQDYKTDQEQKEAKAAKESAYRKLLSEIGVSEKRLDSVMKVSDVSSVELDSDGKIKGEDDLKKSLAAEWADFIPTTTTEGAKTPNPPSNNGTGTMSKDDIMKIKDPVERQNKMAENIELFRKGKEE